MAVFLVTNSMDDQWLLKMVPGFVSTVSEGIIACNIDS